MIEQKCFIFFSSFVVSESYVANVLFSFQSTQFPLLLDENVIKTQSINGISHSLNFCIMLEFQILINTIRVRLFIIYLKGPQVELSK